MKKEWRSIYGNVEHSVLGTETSCKIYDFDISSFDINDKSNSHSVICSMIDEKSKVLDIGCSTGNVGVILTNIKKCEVDGIEYDENTFLIAKNKNVYKHIYNFGFTDEIAKDAKLFFSKKHKYDFIIFGDVLEHIYDPWNALIKCASLLNKGGKIIVSLPNARYIDVIKGLISGEFNYNYYGLLDYSHIRFFTEKSFVDMIYNIADTSNIYYSVELKEKVKSDISYLYKYDIFNLFDIDNELDKFIALQNIFVLKLENSRKSMVIKGIDNSDYFEKMNKEYIKIMNENEGLKNQVKTLESKYNSIIGSKRYKFISKICNILKKR